MRRLKGIRRHAAQIALCRKFAAGQEPTLSIDPLLGSHTSSVGATRIARVKIPLQHSSSTKPWVYDPEPTHSVTAKALFFVPIFVNKSLSGSTH
jgi:hypothetical protein